MSKDKDIRPYGDREGLAFFWVKRQDMYAGDITLVAIDDVGNVTETGRRDKFDEAAMTQEEAVLDHLSGAIAEADAKLERRRARLAENPAPSKLPPMDPATAKFFDDTEDDE